MQLHDNTGFMWIFSQILQCNHSFQGIFALFLTQSQPDTSYIEYSNLFTLGLLPPRPLYRYTCRHSKNC
ncbi:hypothetical protein QWZ13_19325 [Reinekea marina]|uniref:hypothetical protein n=1 Tax=Reinekea marina TaxID=1310421 RepID=UPI0025B33AA5|nr:hypothetical protein [Reinekea marina]MDN3647311.1 hypothetical protein [Reinekea marina]MDN3651067.1 hypothetical protein [Reinekea marina]